MTHCGYDHVARIWRYVYNYDDIVGGSVPTGSILQDFTPCRIEPIPSTMALLEQGLETLKLYNVSMDYVGVNIKENDVIQPMLPHTSWYYSGTFRVIGVSHPSMHAADLRGYLILIVRRNDEAHGIQS